jgi:type IV pilus assembly protein PilV
MLVTPAEPKIRIAAPGRTAFGGLQSGVTLIEILVTLLVLAIGLLGLAALQGISLQSGQISYQRTQAVNVAYEVADFARANRASPGNLQNLADKLVAERLPPGATAEISGPNGDREIVVTITWTDERVDAEESGQGETEGVTLQETFTTRI